MDWKLIVDILALIFSCISLIVTIWVSVVHNKKIIRLNEDNNKKILRQNKILSKKQIENTNANRFFDKYDQNWKSKK